MARKIEAWQSDSGRLFDTEEEARSADACRGIEGLLREVVFGYDYEIDWVALFNRRSEMAELLKAWAFFRN